MALSNILREPRRELIEQGLGVLVVGGVIGLDYIIASMLFAKFAPSNPMPGDFIFAMLVAAGVIFFGIFALNIIHWTGETEMYGYEALGSYLHSRMSLLRGASVSGLHLD